MKCALYIKIIFGLIILSGSGRILANVSISPDVIQVNLNGSSYEGNIIVSNKSSMDQLCIITAIDVNPSLKTQNSLDSEESFSSWIVFDKPEFILEANGQKEISFSIKPPKTACAGIYNAKIQVLDPVSGQIRAMSIITATIGASINVEAVETFVNMGINASDVFSTTSRFFVDANVGSVKLYVLVIPLKEKNNEREDKHKIMLDVSKGVEIAPSDSHYETVGFLEEADKSSSIGKYKTESVVFESAKGTGFRQEVMITVWWQQGEVNLPAGKYTGEVKLVAIANDKK